MDSTPTIDQIDRYVARLQDRKADWDVLKFQADFDPKYRRAQMRYVGTGGTPAKNDGNIIQAGNFTLSTMILPPKNEGPLHVHTDVEEVFFVLEGALVCIWSDGDSSVERSLGYRDLIWIPPGIWRGVRNDGACDAIFLTLLGAKKPALPDYPDGSPLTEARAKR